MAEFKQDYIVTEMKKDVVLAWGRPGEVLADYIPGKNRMMEHVLYIDGDVGTGTFYSECLWFFPPDRIDPEERERMAERMKMIKPGDKVGPQPHIHPFDELFTFFGSNFDDPSDLCGEIEFWLEDQPMVFDKSCIVYIPAGMKHCPLKMNRMDKPLFHFSMGFTSSYDHTVVDNKSGKYAGKDINQYFVFHDKDNLKLPSHRNEIPKGLTHRVAYLDSETVPGSDFFAETAWIWPEERSGIKQRDVSFVTTHTHSFPEVIGFFGTDFNDIHDLCGEVELWVEGKKYIINKSFSATIPAGVEHGPLMIRNAEKPIFHYTVGPSKMYK
jgi:mannose-6-phosphate isomerase-like protein (cupin superfamily)